MAHPCANPRCHDGPDGGPVQLEGRAKTCSARCRQQLSREKRRSESNNRRGAAAERWAPQHQAEEADKEQIIKDLFKEELRPYVREQITEGTIKGIAALVTLMPELVDSLRADLQSIDPVARGRAQQILSKYTMGFMDPKAEAATRPLTIHMGSMPQPGDEKFDAADAIATGVQQECETCHEIKDLSHYDAGATLCNECLAERKASAMERYGV